MSQASDQIAQQILSGFDRYRRIFRDLTAGARARFEQARWNDIQEASTLRINAYEE